MYNFFEDIIKPFIIENKYRKICEIGAGKGANTDKLLTLSSIELHVIDPCIDRDLFDMYKNRPNIKILKGLSLQVLSCLSEKFDCVLIDGDHNWYTVFHELKTVEERNLLRHGGTIFLHDVDWPYGRRDMYFSPEAIPEEFRHPYAKRGMIYNQSELSENSKIGNRFNNALMEGGMRNGVLTAVEDFLKKYRNAYLFFMLRKKAGLGVLIKKDSRRRPFIFIKWFIVLKWYETIFGITKLLGRLVK